MKQTREHQRLSGENRKEWRRWGSYVAARSWGTVREYGDKQKAWEGFPFEYASHRAYRWSEDGIAGFSDDQQRICMAVAFWNGQDSRLKERFFGLSNEQGNHGEDVKDLYFLVDGVPSFSYMNMLYKYPQVEYPYERLIRENAVADESEPSFELSNALYNTLKEKCYFDITIEFAKAGPDDLLYRITAVNRGDSPAPLHILPHVWYRNIPDTTLPQMKAEGDHSVLVPHPELGDYHWYVQNHRSFLFTNNVSNNQWLCDEPNESPYTKDGIEAAVVQGQPNRVNPEKVGTKVAAHCTTVIGGGESWVVRARLSKEANPAPFADFDAIFDQCKAEADEFYAALQENVNSEERKLIQRAAFVGLTWNQHFYNFNVKRWLENPDAPPNRDVKDYEPWKHFDAHDILSIPDPWEYPLLASWDLSFQIETIALYDPEFAKEQALLLLSDRYMREDGAMAAFEGDLSSPHPAVHGHAVWHIYKISKADPSFLQAAYIPLKKHYDWWFKTHQPVPYLFDGGFLGKDNISPIDRTNDVPEGGSISQADSTGWMTLFTLDMLCMAIELNRDEDAVMFLDHLLKLRTSLQTLWDSKDKFFYDIVHLPDGKNVPIKVRSVAGLVPLVAAALFDQQTIKALPQLHARLEQLGATNKEFRANEDGLILISALPHDQIEILLPVLFDSNEFYSPYGIRSLSKFHEKQPAKLELNGQTRELKYEPAESSDRMSGGNSNWRGPIWAPLNDVIAEALTVYHTYFKKWLIKQGHNSITLEQATKQLVGGMVSLFERDKNGNRIYLTKNELFKDAPHWFFEHFDGETGRGLGATHQNGWTAILGKLIHYNGQRLYIPKRD